MIQFTSLTGGTGLSTLTPYFVIASGLTANVFKVSATSGGSEVNFTTNITNGAYERIDYCEGFNLFFGLTVERKGSYTGIFEGISDIVAGSPARAVGGRLLMRENNAFSTYNATNFGAGSGWIATGARGFEIGSTGSQRLGTGMIIHGSPGYESFLRLNDSTGTYVGGFDGNGGVITKVKAGTLADGDFRIPTDGTIALNSSANDLEYRSGSTWRGLLDKSFAKQSCRAASPVGTNVNTASPGATIDGVSMAAGDRVLLMCQTTESQNGIWVWNAAASALTRARDADEGVEMRGGVEVSVEEGTTLRDTKWMLVVNGTPTIGSTTLRWSDAKGAYIDPTTAPTGLRPFAPTNAKLENMRRHETLMANQAALATGTVRVFPLGILRANEVVSTINFLVGTTASAAVTNSWGGIARVSDRVILAISATSTSTTSANTLKTFTFGSSYTPPYDVAVFGFIMYQATVPSFLGIAQPQGVILGAPVINGISNTGQTTPLSVGAALSALTVDTEVPYSYLT